MRAQALGLADAIGLPYDEATIRLKAPWRWLPVGAAPGALSGFALHGDAPAPPWPRLLIACGRRSAIVAAEIKRASGTATRAICIGDPRSAAQRFDLIIAQPHDRVRGANVLLTETSLHRFTEARLNAGREKGAQLFSQLSRPYLGILVGGPVKGRGFTEEDGARLAAIIGQRLGVQGGAALIAVSRRTRPEVVSCLQRVFGQKTNAYFWGGEGENPYDAILASSDRLIVTSDSVTMASEALSTGRPVEIFEVDGAGRRQRSFLERITALNLATRILAVGPSQNHLTDLFSSPAAVSPIDAASFAAQEIRRRFPGEL